MNTVLIFPEPGNVKAITKELLALADRPQDVEYVLWPQEGLRVPEDLALKFEAAHEVFQLDAELGDETVTETQVTEAPVKRKPGRPKKEAQ